MLYTIHLTFRTSYYLPYAVRLLDETYKKGTTVRDLILSKHLFFFVEYKLSHEGDWFGKIDACCSA
jgi:hypothetical protein